VERVPAFVVVGGGEGGLYYVRQLLRAASAGRLETTRIVVVDRDPSCRVAGHPDPRVRLETAEWSPWLDANLAGLGTDDHLVPYHWAPHLLVTWLSGEAERAGATVRRGGAIPTAGVPFERATRDGDVALSYATWICPPTCIEPALCPHTRGPKDWSLASDLERPRGEEPFDGRIVFRSFHLAFGVATIPVRDVHAARDRLLAGLRAGRRRWLVATSSHCHALATRLDLSEPAGLDAGGEVEE
jgi:hypothetical protein